LINLEYFHNFEIIRSTHKAFRKMRKTIAALIVFLTVITISVTAKIPLAFSEVIKVDSISKNELYNRAKLWFDNIYKDAKDVLQLDNKEEGQIIGTSFISYNPKVVFGNDQTKGNIKYTIKIFLNDSRYEYEIADFIHDPSGSANFGLITTDEECPYNIGIDLNATPKSWNNRVWSDIKNQIENNILPLIESLKAGMQ
jgi:hypothetical protein